MRSSSTRKYIEKLLKESGFGNMAWHLFPPVIYNSPSHRRESFLCLKRQCTKQPDQGKVTSEGGYCYGLFNPPVM